MAKLGEAYVEIGARTTRLRMALARARAMVSRSVARMVAAFGALKAAIFSVGMALGVTFGAIAVVAGIRGIIKAYASFEKQMAMVSTMLDEQSMRQMPRLAKGIEGLAKRYGEGTAALSKGLYDILSASIPAEKAMRVLDVSARAAVAGMTDTGVAADALTTIINSYKLSAEDAGMVADKMFGIVKRGKTTFGQLAPAIGRVAATASVAGLSFDEVGGALATMTRNGISTYEAVTALASSMRTFITPATDALKIAEKYGITLDATTLSTIGLSGVLQKMVAGGAGIGELGKMFPNIRALKGMAALFQDIKGFRGDIDQLANSSGKMNEAFDKMSKTVSFRWAKLGERIKDVARSIGRLLLPVIERVIGYLERMVGWVEKNMDQFRILAVGVRAVIGNMWAGYKWLWENLKTFGVWFKDNWGKALIATAVGVVSAMITTFGNLPAAMVHAIKTGDVSGALEGLGASALDAFSKSIKKIVGSTPDFLGFGEVGKIGWIDEMKAMQNMADNLQRTLDKKGRPLKAARDYEKEQRDKKAGAGAGGGYAMRNWWATAAGGYPGGQMRGAATPKLKPANEVNQKQANALLKALVGNTDALRKWTRPPVTQGELWAGLTQGTVIVN